MRQPQPARSVGAGLRKLHFIYRGDPYRGAAHFILKNALYICLELIKGLTLYISDANIQITLYVYEDIE